jgi:hypothetical protein
MVGLDEANPVSFDCQRTVRVTETAAHHAEVVTAQIPAFVHNRVFPGPE